MINNGPKILDHFDKIRFPNDQKSTDELDDNYNEKRLNNFLLENTLQISELSTPNLFNCTIKVIKNLNLDSSLDINFFVYASQEVQAECFAFSQKKCFIRFSSSLVNLLDEDELCFVIGHELGHFLLRHHHFVVLK